MKIRLQIAADGYAATFEHPGPVVRIGRDPGGELALEGLASTGVSREHARIELMADRAIVADAGSSNGTLVNDQPISGSVTLRAGDRLRLGYTGPTLTVLDLDLSAPTAPEIPPSRLAIPAVALIAGGGIAVAAVLVIGLLVIFRKPAAKDPPDVAQEITKTDSTPPVSPIVPFVPPPLKTSPIGVPPARPLKDIPVEKSVGRYLVLEGWAPSVLLARRGEAFPWTPLRPEAQVLTSRALMSLPGYRSEILLDTQVQLTLWGNLSQLCGIPPLLRESAVMLNVPDAGIDLDLVLEWGRVKLANRKESGPARVRLRFAREVWDITLPNGASEVCVELWDTANVAAARDHRPSDTVVLGLFAKGAVQLERFGVSHEQLAVPDKSRVVWPNSRLSSTPMIELPGWWAKPPSANDDRVADVLIALANWAGPLGTQGALTETIQKTVAKTDDLAIQDSGMAFLGALDGAPFLAGHLEPAPHTRTRRAAADALRSWLARSPERADELARYLQVAVRSPQTAERVLDLLYPCSEPDLKKPETYQKLIAGLNDESLAVRELSAWHLQDYAPAEADAVAFNPADSPENRRICLAKWHQELPPGKLPRSVKQ